MSTVAGFAATTLGVRRSVFISKCNQYVSARILGKMSGHNFGLLGGGIIVVSRQKCARNTCQVLPLYGRYLRAVRIDAYLKKFLLGHGIVSTSKPDTVH